MARGDLTCPICGQLLGLPNIGVLGGTNVAQDTLVGGHIHMRVQGSWVCANGHRFLASGEFELTRIV